MNRSFSRILCVLYAAAAGCLSTQANAAIPIADSPLFLESQVAPNLIVTLDDSGSMSRGYVPDLCDFVYNGRNYAQWDCDALDHRYVQSSHYNKLFYDPAVKYVPAKNADGAAFSSTTFTAAWRNGFDPRTTAQSGLGTRDLSQQYRPTARLDLTSSSKPGSEEYMKPYSSDLRCQRVSSRNRCELSKGDGTWWRSSTQSCNSDSDCRDHDKYFDLPAYYYEYVGSGSGCSGSEKDKSANDNCYVIRVVDNATPKQDWNGDGKLDALDLPGERQNFANWYSFARTRNLATQTAATLALNNLNPEIRVAWQSLNSCNNGSTLATTNCQGWDGTKVNNSIKPFQGTHKTDFFNWVSRLPTNGGTPLPTAMQRAGDYFSLPGENSPYDDDLTHDGSSQLSCRRNYQVMMTDGIWNGSVSAKNWDGQDLTLPDNTKYTPRAPYKDSYSPTLADLAFKYWATDLVDGLNDTLKQDITVPNAQDSSAQYWDPANDPASWQHMVNFTIGLGLTSYFDDMAGGFTWDPSAGMYGGSYLDVLSGSKSWPKPGSDKPENVADLWHAAINSRGQFFSADSPDQLSNAFAAAIAATNKAKGSSAALSANSTSLKTGALLFQAKFAENWSGTLLAFNLGARGKVDITKPVWNAAEEIPGSTQRLILTHDGSKGALFETCDDLSTGQKTALDTNLAGNVDNLCQDRMDWLRGNTALEKSKYDADTNPNAIFRDRPIATGTGGAKFTNVMGDIINSDPAYVKNTDFGYQRLESSADSNIAKAGSSYADFVTSNGSRKGMVYVGANDGRMYGIETGELGDSVLSNPNMGRERFAYIPAAVYSKLSNLTDPAYSHRYYADGSIQFGDAYLEGAWKTIVVGGLNAGGRAVYAIDVTDPELFDASSASSKSAATSAVLWEFGPSNDPDGPDFLGYTFSRPQIGILEDGTWVAVFGNGYNSPRGGAYLYIVDLATGKMLRRALASDISGDESNGLSTPVLYDSDNNGLIDTAYAGDLQGGLWRFDIRSASTNSNGVRIFRARDASSKAQPITAKPKIASHPNGGPLLLFGTGRYVTSGDTTDQSTQTFYGIWDKPFGTVTTRANLKQQTFDFQDTNVNNAGVVRSITNYSVNWGGGQRGWYLDLVDLQSDGSSKPNGERVIYSALVQDRALIFSSVIPSTDPCTPGGTSFLYALSYENGGSLNQIVFDTNDDGVFDNTDMKDPPENRDRESVFIGGVSLSDFGLMNIATLLQGTNEGGDADVTYAELASTNDRLTSQGLCLKEGGCGETPEETPPPAEVRKRSWIQIR